MCSSDLQRRTPPHTLTPLSKSPYFARGLPVASHGALSSSLPPTMMSLLAMPMMEGPSLLAPALPVLPPAPADSGATKCGALATP